MALEHELGSSRARIPELHTTVLGARHDPSSVRSKSNRKNEVLKLLARARFKGHMIVILTL